MIALRYLVAGEADMINLVASIFPVAFPLRLCFFLRRHRDKRNRQLVVYAHARSDGRT